MKRELSKEVVFRTTRQLLIALFVVSAAFCAVAAAPGVLCAEPSNMEMAKHIASLLGEKFEPESVTVTVRDSKAYAEMKGVVISGIRIDTMKLDALLTNRNQPLTNDVDALADLIGYSKGEIVLLESDVNAYFDENDIRGFTGLKFNFSPSGFRADGVFSFTFLVTMKIRLAAEGVLALKSDGVHLDNVKIYAENMKQPDLLTNQVLDRVNPLLEWSSIPFKVEFKDVMMDDEKALMTGYPEPVARGAAYTWNGK